MSQRKGQRATARRAIGDAANNVIEALENRQLLASVAGGQVGVFQGPAGQAVRINVTGSGSLDFIGATRDANGNPQMNDIPMTIFDAQGNVVRENLGGFAGRRGIAPVEQVLGDGVGNSRFSGGGTPLNPAQVNYDGLAATNTGQLYGVNRYQALGGQVNVDIVRIDSKSGNVVHLANGAAQMLNLLQQVSPDFTLGDIRDVIGADFSNQAQNQLRFAVNVNFPVVTDANGTIQRVIVPAMFTYNLNTGNVSGLDQAFFGFTGDVSDTRTVDDFTFLDDGTISIFGRLPGGNGGQQLQGIFESDPNFIVMDPGGFQSVQIPAVPPATADTPITSVAAIEAIPGENYYIAVSGTGNNGTTLNAGTSPNAQLYRIDIATGDVTVIGSAVNPDEPTNVQVKLGETVRDLAWNPRSVDNFFQPGKRGVLLGGDSNRDQLVAYDIRERFQNTDLYAIYGQHVAPDTSVTVSAYTPSSDTNLSFNTRLFRGLMQPFTGGAGVIRTNMSTGLPQALSLNNGGLYLGLRTADETNALTQPVLGLDSRTQFVGGKPGVTLPKLVRPGVFISGTMRDLYFGGTITGSVNIDGSIDTFYAGDVVTGDPLNGQQNGTANFFVNGDMRNLIVRGGLGTISGANDRFAPRTDFLINGRVQQIKTGVAFRGAMDVAGNTSEQTIGAALHELEFTPNKNTQNRIELAFQGSLDGGDTQIVDPVTRNDTPASAQIIGSYFSKNRKRGGQATLNGIINNGSDFNDEVDYYGVPLLAGQSIQVQVASTIGLPGIFIAVTDPDGRIYATDQSNQNAQEFINKPIQVTADKPGVWKLSIQSLVTGNVDQPYALTMDKLGEMAVGGLVTGTGSSNTDGITSNRVYLDRPDRGIRVRTGDLGAIVANGLFESASTQIPGGRDTVFANPVQANRGNIRSITATRFARFDAPTAGTGNFPTFSVPNGSIGLLRSDSDMYFNMGALTASGGNPSSGTIIGGDVQVIQAAEDFSANVAVNGSIGVIRVGSLAAGPDRTAHPRVAPFEPGYIGINQDNKGTGELGLIDVTSAEFGVGIFSQGGPTIDVGDGGNVRYFHVLPGAPVFRSASSGNGGVQTFTGKNKSVQILDDSGATITITPYDGQTIKAVDDTTTGGTTSGSAPGDPFGGNGDPTGTGTNLPDPFGGNGNPSGNGTNIPSPFGGGATGGTTPPPVTPDPLPNPDDIVGTVRVSAYPTNGRGAIIMEVSCDTGVAVNTTGGVGDITRIVSAGISQDGVDLGTTITDPATPAQTARLNPSRLPALQIDPGTSLDVILTGSRTNLYEVGSSVSPTDLLNFTRILNNTDGEIVNVRAADVGFLAADYLGVSRPVNGVRIEGLTNVTDARFATVVTQSPFNQLKTAIFIDNASDVRARGPIGNIISSGIIQNLEANSDGRGVKGVNEGIVAPVVSLGSIRHIDIGEGLASSGSGNFSQSGIFVVGRVGQITNVNGGGDLRGDVLVGEYLEGITLGNGASILDADIYESNDPIGDVYPDDTANGRLVGIGAESVKIILLITPPSTDNSIPRGIGDINLTGNGGIMNSRIIAYNHGKITTDKFSYGMINTEVNSTSGSTMRGTNIGGLGIRNSIYSGGSFIGDVTANGNGKVLDVRNFSKSVRGDEFGYFDSMTGIAPNAANDINLYLGTTKKLTKIEGVTNAGVIQDSTVQSARSINSVSAFEIRGVKTNGARPRDNLYPMLIDASQSIGSITTQRNMNGVRIVGGSIESISAGRDITNFQLESNSRVRLLQAGRNYLGTANFNLTNKGSLIEFHVKGNVNGTGFAAQGIRMINVGGNLGSARSQGGLRSGKDINILQVAGNISGSAYIRADRTIKDLILAGDLEADATVRATSFGSQKIDGTVFGDIITG